MIEPELARFVGRFDEALRGVGRRERRRALREARDHVLCATAERESEGLDRADALRTAIDAFGPLDSIAAGYRLPRSRSGLATATGAVLAAAVLAALAFAPTPTSHAAVTTCAGRSAAHHHAVSTGCAVVAHARRVPSHR